jgi:chromate reductase, NAD(P)H dehydrogenase (quinone)
MPIEGSIYVEVWIFEGLEFSWGVYLTQRGAEVSRRFTEEMKILGISGSLRVSSSNTAILRSIARLAPSNIQLSIYDGLGNLPHFNPELDDDKLISSVQDWCKRIRESDRIIFCTPEYAHGVPGVLKNGLDWIVSSGEFMNKPTAVISASPSIDGGMKANDSLVQTLRVMMAKITEQRILCIPAVSAKLNGDEVTDPLTKQSLISLLDSLVKSIDEHN